MNPRNLVPAAGILLVLVAVAWWAGLGDAPLPDILSFESNGHVEVDGERGTGSGLSGGEVGDTAGDPAIVSEINGDSVSNPRRVTSGESRGRPLRIRNQGGTPARKRPERVDGGDRPRGSSHVPGGQPTGRSGSPSTGSSRRRPSSETSGNSVSTTFTGERSLVTGSVQRVDGSGRTPVQSGQLFLWSNTESEGIVQLETSITGGKYSVSVPRGHPLNYSSALVDETPLAVITPASAPLITSNRQVAVLLGDSNQPLLHVIGSDTGEELCAIQVLRVPNWNRNTRPNPGWPCFGDYQVVQECGPLVLDSRLGPPGPMVPIHVRADGYAWGRISVDLIGGGERQIILDPGTALNILLSGDWDRPGAAVRMTTVNESSRIPYMEAFPEGQSNLHVDGVVPEEYRVSIEVGHWAQRPLVLAEEQIYIGEETGFIQLHVEEDDTERVLLGGSIVIPDGWYLSSFTLRVRPISPGISVQVETQEIPSGTMFSEVDPIGIRYFWESDPLPVGTYALLVLPIGFGLNVETGEEGNLDTEVILPDPVTVEVHTVLTGTQYPAFPNLIRWTPVRPPGVPGVGALPVTSEGGGNVFIFDAPIGSISISCTDAAFEPTYRQVQVIPGQDNVFNLELTPAIGVKIYLFDGETPIPWDIGWHPDFDAVEHNGTIVTRGRIGQAYRILVSQPGTYLLTLPNEMTDFILPPPQLVEVLADEILDIDIPLESE